MEQRKYTEHYAYELLTSLWGEVNPSRKAISQLAEALCSQDYSANCPLLNNTRPNKKALILSSDIAEQNVLFAILQEQFSVIRAWSYEDLTYMNMSQLYDMIIISQMFESLSFTILINLLLRELKSSCVIYIGDYANCLEEELLTACLPRLFKVNELLSVLPA